VGHKQRRGNPGVRVCAGRQHGLHRWIISADLANPSVIGQPLKLNQESFTIIGVTPPAFNGAGQVGERHAVTVPIASEPLMRGESRLGTADRAGYWWLNLMGRLKPGATYEQASISLGNAFQTAAFARSTICNG
jgi:MacB-like protein